MPEYDRSLIALLPCPFCGGTDVELDEWTMCNDGVKCNACWAWGPIFKEFDGGAKALVAWNTRAHPLPDRSLIEKLQHEPAALPGDAAERLAALKTHVMYDFHDQSHEVLKVDDVEAALQPSEMRDTSMMPENQMPKGKIELILHSHHVSVLRHFDAEGRDKDVEWALDEAEAVLQGRRPIKPEPIAPAPLSPEMREKVVGAIRQSTAYLRSLQRDGVYTSEAWQFAVGLEAALAAIEPYVTAWRAGE